MKFMTPTFSLLLSALAFSASALPIDKRDVYVPPITSPASGTVWKIGETRTVTWDTSNPPAQITNSKGSIYLRRNGLTDMDHPLATDFDILAGSQDVTVPDVEAAKDWILVLFGDSGNWSEEFTIEDA